MNVNLACGQSYIENWVNLDYSPHSNFVKKTNLLRKLPLKDNCAKCVYSSHFLEHIPSNNVKKFLQECYRITAPNGVSRLVLPDFEELCQTYITTRKNGENDKANFLILEIIDQYARLTPEGELGKYYSFLKKHHDQIMINYVQERTGYLIKNEIIKPKSNLKKIIENPNKLLSIAKNFYCHLIIQLLPTDFKQQNISFTSIGEKHLGAYDFYIVEQLLKQVGYINIRKMSATTSIMPDFPLYPLDVNEQGLARKGYESMYIEAVKL